jgi:hypothetical protein
LNKTILSMKLDKYKAPDNQSNLHEFAMKELNSEIEHLKTLSEKVLKSYTKTRYIDNLRKEKSKKERELAIQRKIKREEKTKSIKKNTKLQVSKDKIIIKEGFTQPQETDPKYIAKYNECIKKEGYLWNIHTKRCVKDTKDNRKKLTLKKN